MLVHWMGYKLVKNTRQRRSQKAAYTSHALALEAGVFTLGDPREIALSLQRSALRNRRARVDPFRSAMSVLTYHVNRAGRKLPLRQRKVLDRAKNELRDVFGKPRKNSRVSR